MRYKRFLKIVSISIVVSISMLYFFQEKLVFYSSTLPQDFVFTFDMDFEELFLTAADGAVLNGLHFKVENPKGIILYCHGNAGEIDSWGQWAVFLANTYNYDVVVWDYRGYGKSTGKRRLETMLEDSFLFYSYCRSHFEASQITLYGRSLGGFFATHLAKEKPVKKLVLESTPATLLEVAKQKYPILPSQWLLKYPFQNTQNITQITTPTFFIHGTADDLVPFEHGERLFRLSKATEKEFFPISGGNHNNLSDFDASYNSALDVIFE